MRLRSLADLDKLFLSYEKERERAVTEREKEIQNLCLQGHVVITCECGHVDIMENWIKTTIYGEFPAGEYQCPACKTAFSKHFGYLKKIPPRL